MNKPQIIISNGNPFPEFEGQPLSWSIGLYDTIDEQQLGYPRMKTVIHAMREYRPEQLQAEQNTLLRASFDRIFGRVAKKQLSIIRKELQQ